MQLPETAEGFRPFDRMNSLLPENLMQLAFDQIGRAYPGIIWIMSRIRIADQMRWMNTLNVNGLMTELTALLIPTTGGQLRSTGFVQCPHFAPVLGMGLTAEFPIIGEFTG